MANQIRANVYAMPCHAKQSDAFAAKQSKSHDYVGKTLEIIVFNLCLSKLLRANHCIFQVLRTNSHTHIHTYIHTNTPFWLHTSVYALSLLRTRIKFPKLKRLKLVYMCKFHGTETCSCLLCMCFFNLSLFNYYFLFTLSSNLIQSFLFVLFCGLNRINAESSANNINILPLGISIPFMAFLMRWLHSITNYCGFVQRFYTRIRN